MTITRSLKKEEGMKKVCCFWAICLTGIFVFFSCKSIPKVKDVSGTVEVLEHKGTAWGVAQPNWVTTVLSTPNQKTLSKELGIDKHIWVLTKQGKDLDFLQTWVDQVDARAEIAASIKQGIADSVTAQMKGKADEEVNKALERYSARAEMIMISGLNKETDWWSKTRTRLDKKSDYEISYNYMVIYSLDEKLYKEQIEKAFNDFDNEDGIEVQKIIEHLSNLTKVDSK